ncbi:MAG: acetyltransferase-like isoleucine patch superfamily enzyme [Psychroserpens sp.]|jgi:acetyltransferase-like isoleucine patch superfamily enzyme
MIKNFLINLLFRILNFNDLMIQFEKNKIDNKMKLISIGLNSKIYSETHISNMQNNKSKIRVGENSHIRGSLQVFAQGGEISVGNYCYIGENSKIWSAENIQIGDQVLISHNVNIHDNISHPLTSDFRHKDYKRILGLENHDLKDFDLRPKRVVIKDKAWIGFNAVILKGVVIGEGAIIGAGCFVTEDVPDYAVIVGNPPKIIKYTN